MKWAIRTTLFLWPLLFLWPCLISGQAIGPWDFVRASGPWLETAPNRPYDVLQMDACLQFTVWRDLVFQSWHQGQIPYWNPYVFWGTPLVANSQSGGFYPPHILMGLLGVPTLLAMTLLSWFHLSWCSAGVYQLCLRCRSTPLASLVAGLAVGASPFMLLWTGLPSVISTVCWIPWALWATLTIGKSFRQLLWLVFFLAMMILAGHLQFVVYGFIAVLFCAVTMARTPKVLVAVALSLVIAFPHLKLVAEMGQLSHRRTPTTAEGYASYQASNIQPYEWLSLADANQLGRMDTYGPEPLRPLSSYWPALTKRGANPAESAITLGPILLAGIALTRWRLKHWRPWAGLALLAILLSSTPVNALLYFGIPGFNATGSPGRISFLFVLACAVWASQSLSRVKSPARPLAIAAGMTLLLAVANTLVLGKVPSWLPGINPQTMVTFAGASAWPFTLLLSLAILLVFLLPKRVRGWGLAAGTLVLALLGPSFPVGRPPADLFVHQPSAQRTWVENANWELLVFSPALWPPNLLTLQRVPQFGGYDSLIDRTTVEQLKIVNGQDPAPPANGNMMLIKPGADVEKLGKMASAHQLEWHGLNHVTTMASPSNSVLYIRNLPGWHARVDGKEVPIPPDSFIQLPVSSDNTNVDLRYEPLNPAVPLVCLVLLPVILCASAKRVDRIFTPK